MQVMQGTSFENGSGSWTKLEVVLDERDLERLTAELGIRVDKASEAFTVLSTEAERLLLVATRRANGMSEQDFTDRLGALRAQRESLMTALAPKE